MSYIRILRRFLRLGHAPLISYLQTMLNRVSERTDFNEEVKEDAARLQELVKAMDQVACSMVARKGELTLVARKKVVRQVQVLLRTLEIDINSRHLPEAEEQLLIHSLGLKTREKRGPLATRKLCAQAGKETGSVRLRTRGQALMYEWWYSTDINHFSNPVYLPPSVVANTVAQGLPRGTYAFFSRTHRKNEPPMVEGPILYGVY
jgi:hypothetical protein